MLKIAVVETKDIAKEIIYDLQYILNQYEWTFRCYEKLATFVNQEDPVTIDILVLPKRYNQQRVYHALIEPNPHMLVICTCEKTQDGLIDQILYINRHEIEKGLMANKDNIQMQLMGKEVLYFQYHQVRIALRIMDINYVEKQDKMILYHTVRGIFKERGSIYEKEAYLCNYGFIRIHSSLLVNRQMIGQIEGNNIILKDKTRLPIARSRKQTVFMAIRNQYR